MATSSAPQQVHTAALSPTRYRPASPARAAAPESAQAFVVHSPTPQEALRPGPLPAMERPRSEQAFEVHSPTLREGLREGSLQVELGSVDQAGSGAVSGQALRMDSPLFRESSWPRPGMLQVEPDLSPREPEALSPTLSPQRPTSLHSPRLTAVLSGQAVEMQSPTYRDAPKPGTLQMELGPLEQGVHTTVSSPLKSSTSHTARCTAAVSDQALLMLSPGKLTAPEVETATRSPMRCH
eukprot:EG_transcript_26396